MIDVDASDQSAREAQWVRVGLAAVSLAYLTYLFTDARVDENLRTLGVLVLGLGLVFPKVIGTRWWAWAVVTGVMVGGIALRPLDVPNHHYMLSYFAGAITVALTGRPEDHEALLRGNARWLIVALMGLATLQRVLSPTFLDGSYIGYELTRGGFLEPVQPLLGEVAETARANDAAALAFRETVPTPGDGVTLQSTTPTPRLAAYLFTAMILTIEAWIALIMWRAPRSLLAHLSIWLFVVTLTVIRQEMTFITVLCAVGLLSCPPTRPNIRLGYAVFTCLFAASVLKTLNVAV